ncbi:bacteriohopanetetrol glucosamine biosynthesis glycosyltransferase HpnI [Acidomonas methanolica]|nr:bacteriohopanetetrol glucosamine biosynthesis glycosyltransferase HpnI [Acidomonas methanolica]MBU2654008.1 bacteriohopanetetrol glucosamine biosynthesis glycosyltransferase HpnI [Acidomonas methanolica]TCS30970.1 ceramide glucosyltransferase [Acidomonas methanolica]GBQ56881.1 ceramide glucosyltransferase [Acidomonas methanolica]
MLTTLLGSFAGGVALAGCAQAVCGAFLLGRFRRAERRPVTPDAPWPPVTVLKPLHGDEPMLEEALESFCRQDYPDFQIIFGVQRPDDPAIAVVRRLQQRFPALALDLVIDSTMHGINHKVGNLINMYGHARHDILVISDSDIHAPPDYLRDVVATLGKPSVGLVTTLYAGLPASRTLVRGWSAYQINQNFLPGVMMSRLLGRRDCLGATMALRRETLERIGGLDALVTHVADDAVLGRAVRDLGLDVELAPCMTWTTTAESSFREMFEHELRWGRTVKNVEPVGYGLSAIQLPLFWASVMLACFNFSREAFQLFLAIWLVRALAAIWVDLCVSQVDPLLILLQPLREWLSALVMVGSARGQRVEWRGQTLHIGRHTPVTNLRHPLEPGD